jgi:hypothetical protein
LRAIDLAKARRRLVSAHVIALMGAGRPLDEGVESTASRA